MSAQFYVKKTRAEVNGLRRRLLQYGLETPLDKPVDVRTIAEAYLGCEVVVLPRLSDRTALEHLANLYKIDISREQVDNSPLAGGLYVTANGFFRWIFVEELDRPTRQRFTIAHEIAHLILEAEPTLQRRGSAYESPIREIDDVGILRFGRCPITAIELRSSAKSEDAPAARSAPESELERGHGGSVFSQHSATKSASLSAGDRARREIDLREIRANHFAAEMLLPYDGVRQIISDTVGSRGLRSTAELLELANTLADVYNVSAEAARTRLIKDLALTPISASENRDLFS